MNRKLVVFVPREALEPVREALFAAGAGRIGDYERCSWYTEGTGTFLGGAATSPDVGEPGREERVAELRLETVYPAEREVEVVAALREAHPYEEPAFDLYVLADSSRATTATTSSEGATLHRRRLAREPGAGRLRLRARGRRRDGARRARRGDRRRHEQRRRVPRAARRPRPRRSSAGSTSSRSSPTPSCSSSRCAASTRSRTRRCASSSTRPSRSPRGLSRVRYTAVRREHNELADRLVNEALDSAL